VSPSGRVAGVSPVAVLVTLAARHTIPAVYYSREFATIGGLVTHVNGTQYSIRVWHP
jgi:hypothetical protein